MINSKPFEIKKNKITIKHIRRRSVTNFGKNNPKPHLLDTSIDQHSMRLAIRFFFFFFAKIVCHFISF